MHHPELVHGKEVVAAGMMFVQNNKIIEIDNESGHYEPDEDSVSLALIALRLWNAPIFDELKLDTRWSHFA